MKKSVKFFSTLLIAFTILSSLSSCVQSGHEYPASIKKDKIQKKIHL